MNNNRVILTILIFVVCLSGCNLPGRKAKKRKAVKKVEHTVEMDIKLAELVLRPQSSKIEINRDPFKPLIDDQLNQLVNVAGDPSTKEDSAAVVLSGLRYGGMVSIGGVKSALLSSPEKKGVFQVNDTFHELMIVDINETTVELKKGEKTFQLKRGE